MLQTNLTYPDLIADDYAFCHSVGKRIYHEGFPGLMTRSARCLGKNINIFKQSALSTPSLNCFVSYKLEVATKTIDVLDEQGDVIHTIKTG